MVGQHVRPSRPGTSILPRCVNRRIRHGNHSTRAVNRQPGYRPGRLVEPFSFRRRRERRRYTHTETQAHKKTDTYINMKETQKQQKHTSNQQKRQETKNTKQQNINKST